MALETEIKILGADLDAVRQRLKELGAEDHGAQFERNLVFDTPDRSLRAADVLLRLRSAGKATLTLKRHPPDPAQGGALKVWEEYESEVADFAAVRQLLEALGYFAALEYEKVRETWRRQGTEICLDQLPFGDFVEIEGDARGIEACMRDLGLAGHATSRETYHALNAQHRREMGLAPEESFVFPASDPRRPR